MTAPAAYADKRYLYDHAGQIVTVWSYKPREGRRIADGHADNAGLSGIGPGTAGLFADAIARHGHAITDVSGSRPANHHVIGCGIGHDDAQFAEAGISMAAYYESGDAFGGHWWDLPAGLGRHFGILTTDEIRHMAICRAADCDYCGRLRERVGQLVCAPLAQCHACGRYGRDLGHLADGSAICWSCRTTEVFAGATQAEAVAPLPDPLTPGERQHLAACSDATCPSCLSYIERTDAATSHVVPVEP